jgi:signal transduction histidine kinase
MDQNLALSIFRIVQEILNNAIKHAEASEIFVQLNKDEEALVIHIEDDGKGFDPNKKYKSMGLENIRSRVNYLKGSLEIDSRKGIGTSFIIHIDVK